MLTALLSSYYFALIRMEQTLLVFLEKPYEKLFNTLFATKFGSIAANSVYPIPSPKISRKKQQHRSKSGTIAGFLINTAIGSSLVYGLNELGIPSTLPFSFIYVAPTINLGVELVNRGLGIHHKQLTLYKQKKAKKPILLTIYNQEIKRLEKISNIGVLSTHLNERLKEVKLAKKELTELSIIDLKLYLLG